MDDPEITAYLSGGRRKTIGNIAKYKQSEMDKLHHKIPTKYSDKRQNEKDIITSTTSMKKTDREKIMKYLWKDMKSENITSLDKTLSLEIVHLSEIDPSGSLLLYAATSQLKSIVEVLLKNKSPICCDEKANGLSPVHIAAKSGSVAILSLMINYNVPLDTPTLYENRTILHLAVKNKREDMIKFLLDKKVDPNARDIYGSSPLNIAVCLGYEDITLTLLNNGADINLPDNDCWAPIHTAIISSHFRIVKLLISHKSSINTQTKYGKTPLHLACAKNNLELVIALLDNDASVGIKDSHGKIPKEYTINREIATMLRSANESQSYAEPDKHIDMQLNSKSLIDLLDEDYLEDHYYSNFDENQNLSSKSMPNLFSNGDQPGKISLSSLVRKIVQNKTKETTHGDISKGISIEENIDFQHEVLAECHSLEESMSSRHFKHIMVNLDTIGEEKSISNDSALEDENYHADIKDDSSHSGSNHSFTHVDIHVENTLDDSDVTEYLNMHDARMRKIALTTSMPSRLDDHEQDTVVNHMLSSTFEHVDRCLTSIAEVKDTIDKIADEDSSDDIDNKVEKLKDYMHKWMESTISFKINFKNKFGSTT